MSHASVSILLFLLLLVFATFIFARTSGFHDWTFVLTIGWAVVTTFTSLAIVQHAAEFS